MKWDLPIVAAALLAVAGVSRRLTDTPFTPAMAFVLIGLLVGPFVLDEVTVSSTSATVRTLAEATLAVVLFADASRIKLRVLRQEYAVPLRLLADRAAADDRDRRAAGGGHVRAPERR